MAKNIPEEVKEGQYRCAWCGGIFDLVRDETWNEKMANEEYKKFFPYSSMENRDVVCDDCWREVKPDG
jgi:hypothetical protein